MNTGEDTQGLRKIIDFTRFISIFIMCIHFYLCCYRAFDDWRWTAEITDRIVADIARTGLFDTLLKPRLAVLLFLIISLIGVKGRRDEHIRTATIITYLVTGPVLYFTAPVCFYLQVHIAIIAISYMILTIVGYLFILSGGTLLSRLIKNNLQPDIFNTYNETFPQEERLLFGLYFLNVLVRAIQNL